MQKGGAARASRCDLAEVQKNTIMYGHLYNCIICSATGEGSRAKDRSIREKIRSNAYMACAALPFLCTI